MATLQSQGTVVKAGDGASPEVFNAIGQITAVDGPTTEVPLVDVSNLSSTAREYNVGLPDTGTFTIPVQYDPANTGQARCQTLLDNRTAGNFQVLLTDSPATQWAFSARVMSFTKSAAIDGVWEGEIVLKVSGSITVT